MNISKRMFTLFGHLNLDDIGPKGKGKVGVSESNAEVVVA